MEVCEARILLTVTTGTEGQPSATDVVDTSYEDYYSTYDTEASEYGSDSPDNPYSSVDYFDLASDSPVADEISEYEDEYYEYETYSEEQATETYSSVTDTTSYPDETSVDGSTGDDVLVPPTDPAVGDSPVGTDDPGVTDAAETDTGSDSGSTIVPFATSKSLGFDASAIPLYALRDSLFEVQPDGTASFNSVSTTVSSVDSPAVDVEAADGSESDGAQDGTTVEPIDVASTVSMDQTYYGPGDWVISQSVSKTWGPSATAATEDAAGEAATTEVDAATADSNSEVAEDGAWDAEPVRGSGVETYSITIVNGTTTITTYSISESFSSGDEDDIPAEWIATAAASVNDTDDDLEAEAADIAADDGAAAAGSDVAVTGGIVADDASPAVQGTAADSTVKKPKGGFTTSSSMTTTITETKITLDDGQPGIRKTVTISWSASFSWHSGDTIDLTAPPASVASTGGEVDGTNAEPIDAKNSETSADALDSETTDSETTGSETTDSETTDSTTSSITTLSSSTDASDGPDIEATYTYTAFASGSIAGSFSVTSVYAEGSSVLGMILGISSSSFGFATSAMAGGSSTRKISIKENSSSGDEVSETDEHLVVDITSTDTSNYFTGFSFAIGNAPDNSTGSNNPDGGSVVTTGDWAQPDTTGTTTTVSTTGDTTTTTTTTTTADAGADADTNIVANSWLPESVAGTDAPKTQRPKAGEVSATDQVAAGISGISVGFDFNSSSSSTSDFTFSERTRNDYEGYSFTEVAVSEYQNVKSDSHFSFGLGGESNHLDIGRSSSSQTNISQQADMHDIGPGLTADEFQFIHDKYSYTEVSSSSSNFGFGLGNVETVGLVNDSSFNVSIKDEFVHHTHHAGSSNTETDLFIYRDSSPPKDSENESADAPIDGTRSDPMIAEDTSPIIRHTTTYDNNGEVSVFVHFEGVPGGDVVTPGQQADTDDSASSNDTGTGTLAYSTVAPAGVPEGGRVDPETGHVYDADGNLFGKVGDDGAVYWPAEWPPGYNGMLDPVSDPSTPSGEGSGRRLSGDELAVLEMLRQTTDPAERAILEAYLRDLSTIYDTPYDLYDSYIEEQRALADEAYQNGAVGSALIFGVASGGSLATEFGPAIISARQAASNIAAFYRGYGGATAGTSSAATGIASEAVASAAFGGPAAFGRLIGWGKGAADAAALRGSIAAADLKAAGITLPVLRYWREFYAGAVIGNRGIDTAVERLKLMQRCIELLGGN